ncbi:DUF1801 domain-containing protein [Paraglaciecola sp.]|uniref:DUF1801 domain-containing protein n=1 Tax=Paraglaciecola sp. TaxID=1920173 RepID=UPI003EFB36A4
MQYDVTTPSAYLETIEQDWRKGTLLAIRALILDFATNIEESIEYKMLSYSLNNHSLNNPKSNNQTLFHLNVQKHFVGLYVGNIQKIDPSGELLAGLNTGKGCIRVSKSINVQQTQLPEFIKRAVELHLAGKDLGC